MIADKIADYVRDRIKARVARALDENLSHGPEALKHIESDIRELAVQVYQYQANMALVKNAMSSTRVTEADFHITCQRTIRVHEIDAVRVLIAEIGDITELSTDLKQRAKARIRSQLAQAENELARRRRDMDKIQSYGASQERLDHLGRWSRGASNDAHHYQVYLMAVSSISTNIKSTLAELIAILESIEAELMSNQNGYAYFIRDCNSWRRSRHQGAR